MLLGFIFGPPVFLIFHAFRLLHFSYSENPHLRACSYRPLEEIEQCEQKYEDQLPEDQKGAFIYMLILLAVASIQILPSIIFLLLPLCCNVNQFKSPLGWSAKDHFRILIKGIHAITVVPSLFLAFGSMAYMSSAYDDGTVTSLVMFVCTLGQVCSLAGCMSYRTFNDMGK